MFTGIVEETGKVLAFAPTEQGWRLSVQAKLALLDLSLGDSIAVDGCCLTATNFNASSCDFDVLEETRRLTSLSALKPNAAVNLERSLRFGGKVGGHFVTGHIDGTGSVQVFEKRRADYYLKIRGPKDSGKYVVHKGSIAIDGISLTVAEVEDDEFAVWLIPHTLSVTGLGEKRRGDLVNLEFDLLGKYVEKLAAPYTRILP